MSNKTMSATAVNNAKLAFDQGIADENIARASTARLHIKEQYRTFYDAARLQRAKQLAPARKIQAEKDEITRAKSDKELAKMLNGIMDDLSAALRRDALARATASLLNPADGEKFMEIYKNGTKK